MFGLRHHAGRIELEGVEDEGAAQQVVTDDHAPLAEARLRNERIGRAEVPRRHLMGRHPWHPFSHGGERSPAAAVASVTLTEA